MAFKFFVLAAFVAVARASVVSHPISYAQIPVVKTVVDSEYDPNPQYTYAYDVQDPFTGDSKSQVESRSGDVVQGQYALNDPDGTRRTVDYTADPINGFNAVVKKTPLVQAYQPIATPIVKSVPLVQSKQVVATPVVTKYEVASPVIAKVATPVVAKYDSVATPFVAKYDSVATPVVAKYDSVATPFVAKYDSVAYSAPVSTLAYSAPVAQKVIQAPVAYNGYGYPYAYGAYNAYNLPYVKANYYY